MQNVGYDVVCILGSLQVSAQYGFDCIAGYPGKTIQTNGRAAFQGAHDNCPIDEQRDSVMVQRHHGIQRLCVI
jgi:hypothetical protein